MSCWRACHACHVCPTGVCVVGVGAVAVQIITAEPDVAIQSLDPAQGDDFLMCALFTIYHDDEYSLAGWLAGWLLAWPTGWLADPPSIVHHSLPICTYVSPPLMCAQHGVRWSVGRAEQPGGG